MHWVGVTGWACGDGAYPVVFDTLILEHGEDLARPRDSKVTILWSHCIDLLP